MKIINILIWVFSLLITLLVLGIIVGVSFKYSYYALAFLIVFLSGLFFLNAFVTQKKDNKTMKR